MSIQICGTINRSTFSLSVNIEIPVIGVTALLGPSGCGKTTLLRIIAGLEHPQNGTVCVNGTTWQNQDSFTPPHKRAVGYVFQEASLFHHLSVKQNIAYGINRVPRTEQKNSLIQVVEILKIGHLLKRKPDTLSGGERQRVAIARALSISPKILLLDEPLASLDITSKHEILPFITKIYTELDIPVIYVTHSPDEVARIADYVVLLKSGQVIAKGKASEILTRTDLPLAHTIEAESLIEATVAGYDESFNLIFLDFPGGRFILTGERLPTGKSVRLRIAARDVSIVLSPQTDSSILNVFPATIEDICPESTGQTTLRLLAKDTIVLARITQKSAALLHLQKGKNVFVQIKTVALLS